MGDKDKGKGNGTGDAQEEQAVDQAWDKGPQGAEGQGQVSARIGFRVGPFWISLPLRWPGRRRAGRRSRG